MLRWATFGTDTKVASGKPCVPKAKLPTRDRTQETGLLHQTSEYRALLQPTLVIGVEQLQIVFSQVASPAPLPGLLVFVLAAPGWAGGLRPRSCLAWPSYYAPKPLASGSCTREELKQPEAGSHNSRGSRQSYFTSGPRHGLALAQQVAAAPAQPLARQPPRRAQAPPLALTRPPAPRQPILRAIPRPG